MKYFHQLALLLSILILLFKDVKCQNQEFKLKVDSMVVYGTFKAFEAGSKTETRFVEVHLSILTELVNNSAEPLNFPESVYFGYSIFADIKYEFEQFNDSLGAYFPKTLRYELPAYRDFDAIKFQKLCCGKSHIEPILFDYWVPVGKKHRVRMVAHIEKYNSKFKDIASNWIYIDKTPIDFPIKLINPNLPE